MTKRILAILLALTLSLTMFALPTFAVDVLASQISGKNEISATWQPVTNAAKYEVSVFYNGSQLGTTSTYAHAASKDTYTHKFSFNASGTYTIQVIAKDGSGMQVGLLSGTATGNYTQTATSNGITFTRDGSSVTASWSAPKTTKGTPVYTVTYKVGTANSVTQKNVTNTSLNITAKETEAVTVTVTYEELNGNILVTSGNIGSATLSATGNATGGTGNNTNTTDGVRYSNGYLIWDPVTATGKTYTYQVTYVVNNASNTVNISTAYYKVPTGCTYATVSYGEYYGTYFIPAGTIGTYTATYSNTTTTPSTTDGVRYSNGYLTWDPITATGKTYTYQVTYIVNNVSNTVNVSTTYYKVPTGCTYATVSYGEYYGSYFIPTATIGTYTAATSTSGITCATGTRTISWNPVGTGATYYIYINNQSTAYTYTSSTYYTVPANITSVTVKYSYNNKTGTIGTITLPATGNYTGSSTSDVTASDYFTLNGFTVYKGTTYTTVTWNAVGGATDYIITYSNAAGTVKGTYSTGGATTYYVPFTSTDTWTVSVTAIGGAQSAVGSLTVKPTASSSTSSGSSASTDGVKSYEDGIKLNVGASSTTVSWDKVSSAYSYYVIYSIYGSSGGFEAFTASTNTSIPFGSTKNFEVYVFAIASSGKMSTVGHAIYIAGDKATSSDSSTTTTGSEYVTGFKGTQANGKIKLAWTAAEGATSYTVYWKRSSKSTWNVATTTSKTAVNLKGLTNGTSYDFKIVANGKDSSVLTMSPSATSTKTVVTTDPTNTTTTVKVPTITTTVGGTGSASVKWAAVTGATSYKVYFAESGSSKYTSKATVSTNGATITGLAAGTYKVRVKALVNGTWTSLSDCEYVTVTVK